MWLTYCFIGHRASEDKAKMKIMDQAFPNELESLMRKDKRVSFCTSVKSMFLRNRDPLLLLEVQENSDKQTGLSVLLSELAKERRRWEVGSQTLPFDTPLDQAYRSQA